MDTDTPDALAAYWIECNREAGLAMGRLTIRMINEINELQFGSIPDLLQEYDTFTDVQAAIDKARAWMHTRAAMAEAIGQREPAEAALLKIDGVKAFRQGLIATSARREDHEEFMNETWIVTAEWPPEETPELGSTE